MINGWINVPDEQEKVWCYFILIKEECWESASGKKKLMNEFGEIQGEGYRKHGVAQHVAVMRTWSYDYDRRETNFRLNIIRTSRPSCLGVKVDCWKQKLPGLTFQGHAGAHKRSFRNFFLFTTQHPQSWVAFLNAIKPAGGENGEGN